MSAILSESRADSSVADSSKPLVISADLGAISGSEYAGRTATVSVGLELLL